MLTTQRSRTYRLLLIASLLAVLFAAIPGPAPIQAQSAPLLDVEWYRQNLVGEADLWNGGLDGESGMGVYDEDFSGFFHVSLNQQWEPTPMRSITGVAQSRAIYMNVEAYRVAGPEAGERFLRAINLGIDFLLEYFKDPDYGGFYWEVDSSGRVVNPMKQGYGNVHPMFALAQAYSVTQNPAHLEAALEQLAVLQAHFFDPDYPGAILPGFSRDFKQIIGVNNVDTFTHLFEPLLTLYDVTEGEQREAIADLIELHGDFLVEHLYHDQAGYTDRGYVAYNYDEEWQPTQVPYTRENQWTVGAQATTGHNIELAYLLSRAVERGFNPDWLNVADKLIRFCLEYTLHPKYGGMIYEITDYEGNPLPGNPDNSDFVWWAQSEMARTLLHFSVVRGADYVSELTQVITLIQYHLTDPDYGGWYHGLNAEKELEPVGVNKGDVWKVNYHRTMLFVEILRLAEVYQITLE